MAINDRNRSPASLSRDITEAARDLANRINLGEFDDLDDGPMLDLRSLSDMMEHWAAVAQALEHRLSLTRATMADFANGGSIIIRR